MNMFDGLSIIQGTIVIVLNLLFGVFIGFLIIRQKKKYYVSKSISGDTVWVLQKSSRRTFAILTVGIVCMCFWAERIFRAMDIFTVIQSAVLIIEIIFISFFGVLPQKICENGILSQEGFIEWSMILRVMETKKEDRVGLKLARQVENEIYVYCRREEKDKLERYIQERIKRMYIE